MGDRALFDLAVDSKLCGCDLVKIKIGTLVAGAAIRTRTMVIPHKTGRPVQFEITPDTRASLLGWLERRGGSVDDFAFPTRVVANSHLSTRQYRNRSFLYKMSAMVDEEVIDFIVPSVVIDEFNRNKP